MQEAAESAVLLLSYTHFYLARATSKDSSSSGESKVAATLLASLAKVPISKNDGARLSKPSTTASKRKADWTDHGDSETQPLVELEEDSQPSSPPSPQVHHSKKQRYSTPDRTVASTAASSTIKSSSARRPPGVKSAHSSWKASQAAASRRSSSTRLDPMLFTLSQSRHLFGSTATAASAFSSLMSIKASLCAKNSYAFWTDIATQAKSREVSRLLAGTSSFLRQTSSSDSGEMTQSDDDSSEEGTSGSQASEDNTQLWDTSSEQESDEGSSIEE